MEREEIIRKNLEKMTGHKEGDMIPLLLGESFGGNAGHFGEYPCAATNFLYKDSGEIAYFGNYPNVPEETKHLKHGVFRIVVRIDEGSGIIVETILFSTRSQKREDTAYAREVISASVEKYNHLISGR